MLNIEVKTIPHKQQRYETAGDYWSDADGSIHIRVSDMDNANYEFLVALHELIEFWLVKKAGISEDAITKFDIAFEAARALGNQDEPGDDPKAPYKRQHLIATGIEKLICAELGLDWPALNP